MERFGQRTLTNCKGANENVLKMNLRGVSLLCKTGRVHLNFVNKENDSFKSEVSGIGIAHIVA